VRRTSQAKRKHLRRQQRASTRFSPAKELRKLETADPVVTLFVKKLGRRRAQQLLFQSKAKKAEPIEAADEEASRELAKAAAVMPSIEDPSGPVAWPEILAPWKRRAERRVRQIVQWRDGHMVSSQGNVPTILVEGRFVHLLESSTHLRELARWPAHVCHHAIGACWWLLDETTRLLPAIVAGRSSSAARVERYRERQRGQHRLILFREDAAPGSRFELWSSSSASPTPPPAEIIARVKPPPLRRSGPDIFRDPVLLCQRVFQAVLTDAFASVSRAPRFPEGLRMRRLVDHLVNDFSAIRRTTSVETARRELRKHRSQLDAFILEIQSRVRFVVMDALGGAESLPAGPAINWKRLSEAWEDTVSVL